MVKRCDWCGSNPLYVQYHDEEWGVPEMDDRALFEKLLLDGFQAGLSWFIILKKREAFRQAFDGFNPEKIARYNTRKMKSLAQDASIVRNRAKISAAVDSARAYLEIEKEVCFSDYIWGFTDGRVIRNRWKTVAELPTESEESRAMSKDLKKRGFRFCGPTICYAFMQAVGMINDHLTGCFRHCPVHAMAKEAGLLGLRRGR